MTWPDPSATVSTTDLDNDTDSLTAARADILDLAQKFNAVLGTCTIASTPWTDLNDTTIQKRIGSPTTNGIVLQDSSGDVIDSGKTTQTTITDSDTKIPTSGAVVDYVAASASTSEWTFLETLTLSSSAATVNIPAGSTSVRLLIDNLDAGTGSGNLLLEIGDSSGYSTTYNSVVHQVGGSSADDQNDFILAVSIDAADDHYGVVELFKRNTTSNDWIIQGKIGSDDTGRDLYTSVGKGVLAGEMDRLQLNFSSAGTFATGTVDIWTYS